MKKLLFLTLVLVAVVSLMPLQAQAGLVPCGATEDDPSTTDQVETDSCTVCHTFKLVNNIEQFLLYPSEFNNNIPPIPALATIFLVIGAFYLITAAGNPEKLQKAKTILTATIVGLIIVYGALMFLGAVLSSTGASKWDGFLNPIKVECAKPKQGGVDIDFGPKEK